jgi:hypothetical protein
MSEAAIANQCSPSSNGSPTSTQRVARLRERRRRGVLHIASVEVFPRDLQVLKRCGYLTTDDPSRVGKDDVENALWRLLDGLAWRLGVLGAGPEQPTKRDA